MIDHALVSRSHAYIENRNDRYFIVDIGSSNGTYVNSLEIPVKEVEIQQDDILFFSRQYSIPAKLLIEWLLEGRSDKSGVQLNTPSSQISIGRDPSNDLVLASLRVALHQVQVNVLPNGNRTVHDLSADPITFLNGNQIGRKPVLFNPGDSLEIAGTQISFDFQPSSDMTRVAATRKGVFLKAEGIDWDVGRAAKSLRILESIDITAFPGEVIGLLGPSGSGKTSLLDILCGTRRATNGSVRFDGISLQNNRNQLLPLIGYVPQDDLLFAELTIREALFYYAKLRLPKATEKDAINSRIEQLCEQLGLSDKIDTIIGAPGNKTLSGGQRKRVNVALELLTDPSILFLDEPTSGLSSRDARIVMELLRKISRESGIAVIVTIHQPSMRVYCLLDYATYLKGGRLCFFGTAVPDSIEYFEPDQSPHVAGPDAIMERLEENQSSVLQERFDRDVASSRSAKERLLRAGVLDRETSSLQKQARPYFMHWCILTRRYFLRLMRSHTDLMVMGCQALVIGGLIGFAFVDQFPLNTPVFLLSFVAIWLSTNNSAREIVSELSVFARERRGGTSPGAYFLSIVTGQFCIAVIQNAIILGLALNLADLGVGFLPALALCCCAGFVGIMVGLLISVLAKTEVSALIAVPLVLVPFILLGGVMIAYDNMPSLFQIVARLTPSKWAYEALLALEQLAFNDLSLLAQQQSAADAKALNNLPISAFSSAYDNASESTLYQGAWLGGLVLIIQAAVWGCIAYWRLRRS